VTALQAAALGLLQGFTEFLPVSSSGHLVLAQRLFGLGGDLLAFDIVVHFGTLLAVVAVFRHRIWALISGCLSALGQVISGGKSPARAYSESPEVRTSVAIVIGTIPAGIVGIVWKDQIERLFSAPEPVLWALAATGILLLSTLFVSRGMKTIGPGRGIVIGIAQAIAIIPGISRSGATISTALFLGAERTESGEFSFLLSLPAVAGATVLALRDISGGGATLSPSAFLIGAAAAFVSGYASLLLLMGIVRRGKIGYFGFYCLAVALAGGAYFLAR
jgi:undecaprenyl-diphosphatase